jgi:hypothetical protein
MSLPMLVAEQKEPPTRPLGAKIWVNRDQEIEEYLRTAECVSIIQGDPRKAAVCTLRPGGPFARMAWRSLPPGVHRGFWESYKGDVAAYAIDKLLNLDMVPPGVERLLQGTQGAAQLWVENVVGVSAGEQPSEALRADWERQLVRMAMFDNLIGNRDRSLGNMIRDSEWNLILLDHSRAFGTDSELHTRMRRIDEALWLRIDSLTRVQLDATLHTLIGDKEIAAILDRREKMRAEIRSLPK